MFLRGIAVGLVIVGVARPLSVDAATWTLGHGDIGVAHDPGSPADFAMEVHVDDGVVDGVVVNQAYEPDSIAINVPLSTNLKRINNPTGFWLGTSGGYDFTTAAYDALGLSAGSNLWVLEDGDTDFTGDSFSVPAGGHVHRTLFFTQPGIYEVGIQAAGLNGGTSVSVSAVYTFQVVPEPSGMALAGLGCLAAGCVSLRRRRTSRLRRTANPAHLTQPSFASA